jgi:arylsulfatase A-like enzyme
VLDRLADEAVLFTRARATSPWTLPSHATLLTGLHSFEHTAHTVWVDLPENRGPAAQAMVNVPGLIDNVRPLPPGIITLPELLVDAGYQTAAIGANVIFLSARYGLTRGFDVYDIRHAHADEINQRVLRWLESRDERPFFLFINYMDAHVPYNSAPRPDQVPGPIASDSRQVMNQLYERIMPGVEETPLDLIEKIVDQYNLGLANLDAELGNLFTRLQQMGLYDDLLLIVTSDHGEYFGEHHLIAHSKDVYEEVMWIPLIVKEPAQRTGRVHDELVSLVHLPRMILSHTRDIDPTPFPYNWPADSMLGENYYTRLKDLLRPWGERFHRVRQVLYRGDLKFILSSDGKNELYDLAADPDEQVNLVASRPEKAAELAVELQRLLARGQVAEPSATQQRPLTEEERRRMKALGYL